MLFRSAICVYLLHLGTGLYHDNKFTLSRGGIRSKIYKNVSVRSISECGVMCLKFACVSLTFQKQPGSCQLSQLSPNSDEDHSKQGGLLGDTVTMVMHCGEAPDIHGAKKTYAGEGQFVYSCLDGFTNCMSSNFSMCQKGRWTQIEGTCETSQWHNPKPNTPFVIPSTLKAGFEAHMKGKPIHRHQCSFFIVKAGKGSRRVLDVLFSLNDNKVTIKTGRKREKNPPPMPLTYKKEFDLSLTRSDGKYIFVFDKETKWEIKDTMANKQPRYFGVSKIALSLFEFRLPNSAL